jgi:bleomycin hydrolase
MACDISKYSSQTHGLLGYSYFPDSDQNCLSKKERLMTFDSVLSHAVVLHGYSDDKWKIENSWGNHGNFKGFYLADHKWFEDFVYQIIVPKSMVKKPKNSRPRKYKPWDQFGNIAMKPSLLKL